MNISLPAAMVLQAMYERAVIARINRTEFWYCVRSHRVGEEVVKILKKIGINASYECEREYIEYKGMLLPNTGICSIRVSFRGMKCMKRDLLRQYRRRAEKMTNYRFKFNTKTFRGLERGTCRHKTWQKALEMVKDYQEHELYLAAEVF